MNPKDVKIGDEVTAKFAYARKGTHRFPFNGKGQTEQNPIPLVSNFTGFVVGKRSVIMTEYKYHDGSNHYDNYEPAYSTGKKEYVLLVCKNERVEPLIVRFSDLIDFPPIP